MSPCEQSDPSPRSFRPALLGLAVPLALPTPLILDAIKRTTYLDDRERLEEIVSWTPKEEAAS
jgi:hypothetical protein